MLVANCYSERGYAFAIKKAMVRHLSRCYPKENISLVKIENAKVYFPNKDPFVQAYNFAVKEIGKVCKLEQAA